MEEGSIRMGVINRTKDNLERFCVYISRIIPYIESLTINKDIIYMTISANHLRSVCSILQKHNLFQFKSLLDVWGVDYPSKAKRFEINYLLLSVKYNIRLIVRVSVEEFEGVQSLHTLYKSSTWLEREVWDMYGVLFFENPDLRRILTDYGFNGHPLRKDFPLSGFMEVRYDDSDKRVVYEPVEFSQQYRVFNFKSPWEKL